MTTEFTLVGNVYKYDIINQYDIADCSFAARSFGFYKKIFSLYKST